MFTQLKATLRAGWKGAEVGGERAEDRSNILADGRATGNLLARVGLRKVWARWLDWHQPGGWSHLCSHLTGSRLHRFVHGQWREDELCLQGCCEGAFVGQPRREHRPADPIVVTLWFSNARSSWGLPFLSLPHTLWKGCLLFTGAAELSVCSVVCGFSQNISKEPFQRGS